MIVPWRVMMMHVKVFATSTMVSASITGDDILGFCLSSGSTLHEKEA